MAPYDKNTKLLISASSNPGNNGTFFYNRVFAALQINAVYLARKFDNAENLKQALDNMDIFACSVSSPLKEKMLQHTASLTASAQELKSVNSLKKISDGKYLGTNTDAIGFLNVLRAKKIDLHSVLIYGSGGVVPSLVWAIRNYAPNAKIEIAARNLKAKEALINRLNIGSHNNEASNIDLFINSTPSQPNTNTTLIEISKTAKWVFDISASLRPTEFLNLATSRKQTTMTGFEMFLEQFKAQFEFYFDRTIPDDVFSKIVSDFYKKN